MKEGGGVCALMHVYTLEHIISLSYRTTLWMFTKLDRDEVLIVHAPVYRIFGELHPGADPGQGDLPKIGQ